MTREEFYQSVKQYVKGLLPEQYANKEIHVGRCVSQRGEYMGLTLRSEEPRAVMPVLNLDLMYEQYGDMDEIDMMIHVSDEIQQIYEYTQEERKLLDDETLKIIYDYDYVKTKLFISPASVAKREAETLALCKYVEDIPLEVRIMVLPPSDKEAPAATAVITENLLSEWGKTFNEVYEAAFANMEKICPTTIVSLADTIRDLTKTDMDIDMGMDVDMDEISDLLVSNEGKNHGAANLFLPGVMEKVSEMVQGSYFVFPSSIHETLIHPLSTVGDAFGEKEIQEFEQMIRDINDGVVFKEEQLSNQLYFYNANEKRFGLARSELAKMPENDLTKKDMESPEQGGNVPTVGTK